MRSYLERIEKNGGGTLVLKKGTYTVSNTLYIPSNTTIKLLNGAVIKKGTTTGKATYGPSKTLLQLVTPKKATSKSSVSKYSGAKNIKILGSGTATIDLNYAAKSPAIAMAHAQNVQISGIKFQKNNQATMVHIIGSKSVTISANQFLLAKEGTAVPAVRLEAATKSPGVYPLAWSKLDGTTNATINVSANTFDRQYTAIKSTDFVNSKYQTSIIISKNKFSEMENSSLYITGWNKPSIANNSFDDSSSTSSSTIVVRASIYPSIKNNTFKNSKNALTFRNITGNSKTTSLSTTNKNDLATNKGTGLKTYAIQLPENEVELLTSMDPKPETHFEFSAESEPVNNRFKSYSTYSDMTKPYYVLRSMLERLEKDGGGSILIKAGDYTITNNLYVPSNVTIEMEDGTILRKAFDTGIPGFKATASIFQLIAPSKATVTGAVGGYDGTKNVKIFSNGRATIDLQGIEKTYAIVLGHNENITIQNINFTNLNGGHFIELDASKDVLIDNATFTNNLTKSTNFSHEAINLDTPDRLTRGFNARWSNYDRSGNLNVTIQNSTFRNLVCSIGTHQMSGAGLIDGIQYESKPHTNIVIKNNTFIDSRSEAIHAKNWDAPIIENNTFINNGIANSRVSGIVSAGSINPTIRNNHFEALGEPIVFILGKNASNAKEYEVVYNSFTQANLNALATNSGKYVANYSIKLAAYSHNNLGIYGVNILRK